MTLYLHKKLSPPKFQQQFCNLTAYNLVEMQKKFRENWYRHFRCFTPPPPQSRILILNFCINLPNYIKSQSIRPTDSNVGYPWTFWNVSAAHSICLSVAIWWLVKFRTEHIGQRSYIQFSFTTFVGRSVTKVSIWWVTYIDPELLIDLHVKSLTFVGEFAKLQNATVRSVVSVRLSVQMKRPTSRWTDFMKLDIWLFSANLSRKFKFH